jgi:hypothetical protein
MGSKLEALTVPRLDTGGERELARQWRAPGREKSF